jgi:hypothetical protein
MNPIHLRVRRLAPDPGSVLTEVYERGDDALRSRIHPEFVVRLLHWPGHAAIVGSLAR